jgi:hypothetical protein
MISFLYLFLNLLPICLYDAYRQNKSESIYWYGRNNTGGYYDEGASEASSQGQFRFWYYYVIFTTILLWYGGYFFPNEACLNFAVLVFWHWCGVEDLGYAIASMFDTFAHPYGYYQRHPAVKILGIELPLESYWLSRSRTFKLWFITIKIPSIIGFICGERVPAKKFLALSLCVVIATILVGVLVL